MGMLLIFVVLVVLVNKYGKVKRIHLHRRKNDVSVGQTWPVRLHPQLYTKSEGLEFRQ